MKIHFPEGRDVLLRNVQTRMEKHGEDDVPALDLAVSVTGGNELLDMIDPGLRPFLFKPLAERAGELPLPTDDLPSIRFPFLKMALKIDREHEGMTAKVAWGASGRADMVLGGVRLSKVEIEQLIEGGSVEIRFNLSTKDVSEKVIGKLSLMQKHQITLTLTQPEVEPEKAADPFNPFPDVDKDANPVNSITEPTPATPEELFAGTDQPAE